MDRVSSDRFAADSGAEDDADARSTSTDDSLGRRSGDAPRSDAGTKAPQRPPPKDDDSAEEQSAGKQDDAASGKKKGSRLPLIILGIVVVLGAIGGGIWWYLHRDQVNTDDAYTDGRVVMMSPQVNGYVTVLAVNDNQFVHKGDLLVQIDPRPYEAARD